MNGPKKYATVFLLLSTFLLQAQHYPFYSYKQLSLGGAGHEFIMSAVTDASGNFLIVGNTQSASGGNVRGKHGAGFNVDWWTVKLDGKSGDTIWISRALGGSSDDILVDGFASSDGNYVLAGLTKSNDGDVRGKHGGTANWDMWMVKLDGNTGDTLWTSTALGGSDDEEYANYYYSRGVRGCEGKDGNYLIAGMTRSADGHVRGWHPGNCGSSMCNDWWAVKINRLTGDTIWTSRALGGTRAEYFNGVTATSDGHYVLSGYTASSDGYVRSNNGSFDWWAVKLNGATGDTIWTTRGLGGSSSDRDAIVFEASDGHYILSGVVASGDADVRGKHPGTGYNQDYWMIKLNKLTGDTIWTSPALGGGAHEFGSSNGTPAISGELVSAFEAQDGHYVLAGETYSNDGDIHAKHGGTENIDWVVFQINENTGDTLRTSFALGADSIGSGSWPNSYRGFELLCQMLPTCDGGYLLSGTTRTTVANGDISEASLPGTTASIWAIKLDENLRREWDKLWSDGFDIRCGRVFPTQDGGYLFTGLSQLTPPKGAKTVTGHGYAEIWTSKVFWKDTLDADFAANSYTVCPGMSIQFSDSAKGLVAIPKHRWYWNFGDGDTSSLENPLHAYDNPGTYTVTQVVAKECQFDTMMRVITVLPEPTVYLRPDTVICSGDTIMLDAGSGNISYYWSTGQSSQTIYADTAGIYAVTVTGFNGCSKDTMVNITVAPLPILSVAGNPKVCLGSNTTLTAMGANTYLWNPSIGLSGTIGSVVIANPTSLSSYIVIGTDTNGCTSFYTFSISVNIPPIANAGDDTTICNGESVVLVASGGFSYLWSTGQTNVSIAVAPTITTVYVVEVADSLCSGKDSVAVNINNNPVAAINGNITITEGQSTTLSVSVSSGSGGYKYSWLPAEGIGCDTCQQTVFDPSVTTSYSVIVTDSNGCSTISVITITVEELPCTGENIFLPNAFSPNNDGENDVLMVKDNCLAEMELVIYSRWGKIIFKTTDKTSYWDGRDNGKLLNSGVFLYKMSGKLTTGEYFERAGNIYLLR